MTEKNQSYSCRKVTEGAADLLDTLTSELAVASRDPLALSNGRFEELRLLLASSNLGDSRRQVYRAVQTDVTGFVSCPSDAKAALRDLSMMASMINRRGFSLHKFPELTEQCLLLGDAIDEVPRDTVYSYTVRNPETPSTRKFTDSDLEQRFIQSTRNAVVALTKAAAFLGTADAIPVADSKLCCLLESAHQELEQLSREVIDVLRYMPPSFFTGELRPYFEPMVLDSRVLLAPGGAQMPLLLIDWILWGKDETMPEYQWYFSDNMRYLPAQYRSFRKQISSNRLSLVSRTLSAHRRREDPQASLAALRAIKYLLQVVQKFRYPHLRLARENFRLRELTAVGSGGYEIGMLKVLIDLTSTNIARIENVCS